MSSFVESIFIEVCTHPFSLGRVLELFGKLKHVGCHPKRVVFPSIGRAYPLVPMRARHSGRVDCLVLAQSRQSFDFFVFIESSFCFTRRRSPPVVIFRLRYLQVKALIDPHKQFVCSLEVVFYYCFDLISQFSELIGLLDRLLLVGDAGYLVECPSLLELQVVCEYGPPAVFLVLELLAHEGPAHLVLVPEVVVEPAVFYIKINRRLAGKLALDDLLVDQLGLDEVLGSFGPVLRDIRQVLLELFVYFGLLHEYFSLVLGQLGCLLDQLLESVPGPGPAQSSLAIVDFLSEVGVTKQMFGGGQGLHQTQKTFEFGKGGLKSGIAFLLVKLIYLPFKPCRQLGKCIILRFVSPTRRICFFIFLFHETHLSVDLIKSVPLLQFIHSELAKATFLVSSFHNNRTLFDSFQKNAIRPFNGLIKQNNHLIEGHRYLFFEAFRDLKLEGQFKIDLAVSEMAQYPKVQYLYSKLLENTESMVSRTFKKILSTDFIGKVIPVDSKTPYEQQLLRELLKQLHSYAVKVAMIEVVKINEKHKIASVAEINAQLHFRKKVLKEIDQEEEWTTPELDEEKLFLETLQSQLHDKLRALKDQQQIISHQFNPPN